MAVELQGNIHIVSALGDNIVVLSPPTRPMTKTEALEFAAYVVAMAEDPAGDDKFPAVLEAVRNT